MGTILVEPIAKVIFILKLLFFFHFMLLFFFLKEIRNKKYIYKSI